MFAQRTDMRPALTGFDPGRNEKDNVAKAIDNALIEVQAARRDLRMTGFCMQQAEAIRRIDRARAFVADW